MGHLALLTGAALAGAIFRAPPEPAPPPPMAVATLDAESFERLAAVARGSGPAILEDVAALGTPGGGSPEGPAPEPEAPPRPPEAAALTPMPLMTGSPRAPSVDAAPSAMPLPTRPLPDFAPPKAPVGEPLAARADTAPGLPAPAETPAAPRPPPRPPAVLRAAEQAEAAEAARRAATPGRQEPVRAQADAPRAAASPSPPLAVQAADQASGQASGGGQTAAAAEAQAMAAWHSALAAAIARAAPQGQPGAGEGTLAVTVAREGRLVSVDLARSSGNPALDRAAVQGARRARLPAAPPGAAQAAYAFTLRFR